MKRTSLTHPLQIAIVSAGPDFGRVGITFCPGKYDRHAMTGEWVRDLSLDLDRVRDWGAAAVVTLLEPEGASAAKGGTSRRGNIAAEYVVVPSSDR